MPDIKKIKSLFPIFSSHPDLVYFDNAATTQKPDTVINAVSDFYQNNNANILRGVYPLSAQASKAYEEVRKKTATFIGAKQAHTVAFTKGTTEAINIVANSFLKGQLQAGDNIVISAMEHHANLIPWQMLARGTKAELRIIPVDHHGNLQLNHLASLLDSRTKLLATTVISNTIGTINPIEELIRVAKKQNIPVLLDGAQSTGLYPINVFDLDCDFYAFSAHKMFGPFGVGALYVHPRHHEAMLPVYFGGGAIRKVSFGESSFLPYPFHLEAGTPNIAGIVGLGAAIHFCENLDRQEALAHIKQLETYLRKRVVGIEGVRIIGQAKNRTGILSFVLDKVHPHDLAQFLAEEGIAVRAGHHCTQPLLNSMGVEATLRVSFSIYNHEEEVDHFIDSLKEIIKFWS